MTAPAPLSLEQIRSHWHDWATRYGQELRATTKTPTIKALEMDALARALRRHGLDRRPGRVLEVGTGNGINVLGLARSFPQLSFLGIDYVPEMVDSAKANLAAEAKTDASLPGRVRFAVGDATRLHESLGQEAFDAIITDRLVINLRPWAAQAACLDDMTGRLLPGGALLILENFTDTYDPQNGLRVAAGLPARTPAEFNLFMETGQVERHLAPRLRLLDADDFGSLHDIVLYVLVPLVNGGQVDYDHPMVKAATTLTLGMQGRLDAGRYGQNRLLRFTPR